MNEREGSESIDDISARVLERIRLSQSLSDELTAEAGRQRSTIEPLEQSAQGYNAILAEWGAIATDGRTLAHTIAVRTRAAVLSVSSAYLERIIHARISAKLVGGGDDPSRVRFSVRRTVVLGSDTDAAEACDRVGIDEIGVRLEGAVTTTGAASVTQDVHVHFALRLATNAADRLFLETSRPVRVRGNGLVGAERLSQALGSEIQRLAASTTWNAVAKLPFLPFDAGGFVYTHDAQFRHVDLYSTKDLMLSLRLTSVARGTRGSGDVVQVEMIPSLPSKVDAMASDVVPPLSRPVWSDISIFLHLPKLGAMFAGELARQIAVKGFKNGSVIYQGLGDDPRPGAPPRSVMKWFASFTAATYDECVDLRCGWDNWSYRCHCNNTVRRTLSGFLAAIGEFVLENVNGRPALQLVVSILGRSETVRFPIPLGDQVVRVEPSFAGDFAVVSIAYERSS